MAITITRTDARYAMLRRSRNLRWDNKAEAAAEIEMCETAEQAAESVAAHCQRGLRPTIRSGGHCYEDFVVNNPGGAILDLSLLTSVAQAGDGERYRISPGQQLGEVYLDLYKRHGVTIPAGSCYSVGAGGHITGAGFWRALAIARPHRRLAFGQSKSSPSITKGMSPSGASTKTMSLIFFVPVAVGWRKLWSCHRLSLRPFAGGAV